MILFRVRLVTAREAFAILIAAPTATAGAQVETHAFIIARLLRQIWLLTMTGGFFTSRDAHRCRDECWQASVGLLITFEARLLELLQPGVHFIVAYNLSPELSNHQAGVSHYEAMQSALLAWAQTQPAETSDQFSLAANTGMQLIRSEDPREWAAALAGYQPNLLAETPNLNSLTRAVDLAIDANSGSQRRTRCYSSPR